MGLKVEKQEGSMALLTIDVPAEEFDKATEHLLQRTISKTRKTLEEAKEKKESERNQQPFR